MNILQYNIVIILGDNSCDNSTVKVRQLNGLTCTDNLSCAYANFDLDGLPFGYNINFNGIQSLYYGNVIGNNINRLNCNGKQSCENSLFQVSTYEINCIDQGSWYALYNIIQYIYFVLKPYN